MQMEKKISKRDENMKIKEEKIILPKAFFIGMSILTIIFIILAVIFWILGRDTNPFAGIAIFMGICTLAEYVMNEEAM